MSWLCKLFGHRATTTVSKDFISLVGPPEQGAYLWPGKVWFCPRCGFVYKGSYDVPRVRAVRVEFEINQGPFAGSSSWRTFPNEHLPR